jgi:hypothetical protein
MKKWIWKAVIQKSISYLPFSQNINYVFQKFITKGVTLTDEYFYDRLGHARDHIKSFQKYSGKKKPTSCLEIGTGWYPIVPISMFLIGANQIYSVDIAMLTSKKRLQTTLQKFLKSHESAQLKTFIPFLTERFELISDLLANYDSLSLKQVLDKLNITYLIEDARILSLNDDSIDLINSNNTFEHIYPEILTPILKEFKRVVKKHGGIMSHFIDLSDHFAHFDQSINIYNFLQFSDQHWKWIDNTIQPQNRMRIDDYQQIFTDLGIPITEQTFREGNVEELKTIKLSEQFTKKPMKDLAVSHCCFVSDMSNHI